VVLPDYGFDVFFRPLVASPVTGDNSVLWPTRVFTDYQAGPGWDPVTGWGSPNAHILVPLLAHVTHQRKPYAIRPAWPRGHAS
jgi:hypothetical protein